MGKNVIRDEATRRHAVEMMGNGATLAEASAATGYGENYVRQLCKRYGVQWQKYRRVNDTVAKIKSLAEEGYTAEEIAQRVGKHYATVQRLANKNSIGIQKKKKPRKFDWDEVRSLYKDGKTSEELAQQFNTSACYIRKICRGIEAEKQYKNGTSDRIENAKWYVEERTPGFEYAGNFTGIDGRCDIKCKTCGTVTNRSFVAIRHGNVSCRKCRQNASDERNRIKQKAKEARIAERKAEKEEQKRQRELRKEYKQYSMNVCPICGQLFIGSKTYCSSKCRERNQYAKKDGYRYLFPLEEVYKRDNGICYICGKPCDWNDKEERHGIIIYGNNYPSRDHVIPRSKGGANEWANIRLAHRICNSLKSDSPFCQKTG